MASDESFKTPASSTEDLLILSPRQLGFVECDQSETSNDFFCDSLCNITMHEVLAHDDMCMDSKSLDYLDKCTASNKNPLMIDRGRDSLFVKFDPLYAKTKILAQAKSPVHFSDKDIGYETCSTTSVFTDNVSANSKCTSSTASVFSKSGIDKPTQVVSPVVTSQSVNSTADSRVPTLTRSVSAILTPTQVGPEILVNLYGNTSSTAQYNSQNKYFGAPQVDTLHSLRIILQNQDQELLKLRREKKELEYSIQSIKEQFEDKITKLTSEVDTLKQKECKLVQHLNDKSLSYKEMAIVMEEYEKTISLLIEKQEKLSVEKEQALNHLASMESSFNDLLKKYESSKLAVSELKDNQKELVQKISEYEAGMQKYDCLYNTLKQSTTENLNKANETLDNINKSHSIEITKLNAVIKKQEITLSSLQESLSQKNKEIEELTRLNDQLINDVH